MKGDLEPSWPTDLGYYSVVKKEKHCFPVRHSGPILLFQQLVKKKQVNCRSCVSEAFGELWKQSG